MTIEEFGRAVTQYRRAFNGSVTSWGRSAGRNRTVGGAPRSAHLVDLGADVVPEPGSLPDHRVAHGHVLGLLVVVEEDHDHLQPLDYLA